MTRKLISAKSGEPEVLQDLLTASRIKIGEVRRRLSTALRRERQDGLGILVCGTLRRLVCRPHLTP